jgi:adenylosuccinate lyase
MKELPFMATENIMMAAVKKGGDRQELHELIRKHSIAASNVVKEQGEDNDLIDRISGDPAFGLTKDEIISVLKPINYIGRSVIQVEDFLRDYVNPVLTANKEELNLDIKLNV